MEKTISECFSQIKNGANIKQGIKNGGFPITRIETISNDKFNRDKMGYAGITDASQYENYILEDNDLLMSHINSPQYLGRTVLYKKVDNETIIHGMNLLRLKANKEVNPSYARYYFYGNKFRQQIIKITKKSVNQASFAVNDLKRIKMYLPEMESQNNIVRKLDIISKLIDFYNEILNKYDLLIKARFIEMFGDPVSNSKHLPLKTLPQLGTFGRGVSKYRPRNAPELLNGPYPLIQTGDIANSELYIKNYNNTYSEVGLKQSKMWDKGTLCITIAANIAKTAILQFDACFPDSVVGFNGNNLIDNIFVHYWFSFFQEILENQAPESAQKNINLKILSELQIITPDIIEQNQFADFVRQVDKSRFDIKKSIIELEREVVYD